MFGNHKLRVWAVLGGCVCATAGLTAPSSKAASSSRSTVTICADYNLIDIHGSGGGANEASPTGVKFADKLQLLWPSKRIKVEAVPFKAAGGPPALLGAGLNLPLGYHQSVVKTKNWLRSRLQGLAGDCPNTKVILSGYSQGAQVVGDIYQERSWSQVVGVALFGDPYYNHLDSSNRFGLNIKPKQRSKTKLDGSLAAPRPRKAFNSKRVLSFCHQGDPFCQAPLSSFELAHFRMGQHKNYTNFKEPEMAAEYFVGLIATGGSSKPTPKLPDKWPTKRKDGSTGFFMYLGANFIWPAWSSCTSSYCIVGAGDTVLVFSIAGGIDQVGWVRTSTADPRAGLRQVGVPDQDIDKLLAP